MNRLLPKLNQALPMVDPATGFPTAAFVQWWNNAGVSILGLQNGMDDNDQAPLAQFTPIVPDDVAPVPQFVVVQPDDQVPVPQQIFFAADDVLPLIAGLRDEIAMLRRAIDDLSQGTTA